MSLQNLPVADTFIDIDIPGRFWVWHSDYSGYKFRMSMNPSEGMVVLKTHNGYEWYSLWREGDVSGSFPSDTPLEEVLRYVEVIARMR